MKLYISDEIIIMVEFMQLRNNHIYTVYVGHGDVTEGIGIYFSTFCMERHIIVPTHLAIGFDPAREYWLKKKKKKKRER